MAYDEYFAERITKAFEEMNANFYSKKMMGGLVFMVNDKMACGIHYDKKEEVELLMARIGPEAAAANLGKPACMPMTFTGRTMKGYVFIIPEGYDTDSDLYYWLKLTLDYNPFAKASKKKKSK